MSPPEVVSASKGRATREKQVSQKNPRLLLAETIGQKSGDNLEQAGAAGHQAFGNPDECLIEAEDVCQVQGKNRDEDFLADAPEETQESDVENVSWSLLHVLALLRVRRGRDGALGNPFTPSPCFRSLLCMMARATFLTKARQNDSQPEA